MNSERGALEFFIERIQREAREASVVLSDSELRMLRSNENNPCIDPNFKIMKDVMDFQKKAIDLLKNAYEKEIRSCPDKSVKETVKQNYRDAYRLLDKKDNFIQLILKEALKEFR